VTTLSVPAPSPDLPQRGGERAGRERGEGGEREGRA
jgi:hypothetical protein